MNETIQNILSRRSTRAYKPEQITAEDLHLVLEAGQYAPSAANQQSWHIVAVQNKDMLKKLSETFRTVYLKSGIQRFEEAAKADDFNPFYNAPTYIMVFADDKAIAPTHDGSLAIGNMLLAAEALGLGGCWLHAVNFVFKTPVGEALKGELGIPEGYSPVGAVAIGYKAAETATAAPRREGTVTVIK
ncbi:MAG: nitroreductase family protein [Clostridia bacterium]|nr:nitroreductase family protein [Clostridia bacterium]MDR3645288.1 nitroreductase family protein [Clostridia bacterium]